MTDIPMPPAGSFPQSESAATTPPPARTPPPRDSITAGMVDALAKTKPWVRFLAVVGFVMAGLMLLVSLGVIGVGIFTLSKSGTEGAVLIGMGVLYLLLGVLYVFPSRFLWRYANAIQHAMTAQSKAWPIQQALEHQKSFWKFAGIMTLVTILLYIPGILLAVAIPNLLTAMQRSKQKRTMADMRTIATALEAEAKESRYYPRTMDIDALAKVLEPKHVATLPRLDAWSNPIRYQTLCGERAPCESFLLMSAGKNGAFEQSLETLSREPKATTNFDDDIVLLDGQWLRYPENTVK